MWFPGKEEECWVFLVKFGYISSKFLPSIAFPLPLLSTFHCRPKSNTRRIQEMGLLRCLVLTGA